MKAVMYDVPQHLLDERRRIGADRRDEMWEGVLHMVPPASFDHQELESALLSWLRVEWGTRGGNKVVTNVGVSDDPVWTENYRVPDIVLLKPDCFDIIQGSHLHGPPTVVVEIHSPGDEAYKKLSFYAELGVPEVWVIDRDSKRPELYELAGAEYKLQEADTDGWLKSAATGVWLGRGEENKLRIRLAEDDATEQRLP